MSLLGYLMALLNVIAAGAFLYLAVMDYSIRQAWSYAVYRYDLALNGMPVDKEDRDEKGQPRYLNMNDKLRDELTGKSDIETQEDALEARHKEILLNRIEDPNVKSSYGDPRRAGEKVPKYVEVLLPLARDAVEREALLNQLGARDFTKLAQQFDDYFAKAKAYKDRDEKRRAIARLLVVLVDALPTDDEKKQRSEDAKKPPNQRSDPTLDPTYQKMLGAVGTRAVAAALDEQAHALLEMATDVKVGRDDTRRRFADTHDAMLRELELLEDRLQSERDQLAAKLKAASQAESLRDAQKKAKEKIEAELEKQRAVTAALLDRLTEKQNDLFMVRVRLRDANRINQQLEADIRTLERRAAKR
ncbi:MAG: hypothetical protein HYS12_03945 [Planctomycetes bacterium]|nr:hypothetical protein [Planctomycetota bacterium]